MNLAPFKIGRTVYAIPFAIFGLFHFMNGPAMAAMVPIPGGIFWVYLTGVCLIAACIAILTGKYARLACQLLALMLLIFVLALHLPGVISGNEASMPNLLKDLSLAGAAWVISGTFPKDSGIEGD